MPRQTHQTFFPEPRLNEPFNAVLPPLVHGGKGKVRQKDDADQHERHEEELVHGVYEDRRGELDVGVVDGAEERVPEKKGRVYPLVEKNKGCLTVNGEGRGETRVVSVLILTWSALLNTRVPHFTYS